ncbi:MAG TPA: efflux RND transporter periplasmic adaptor subunit [Candidatus Acidoferrum sp.]|nr:efflux RND transporter periplasmic adaptor subunit [Candidatus Acidoferrum sp.]
MIEEKEYDQLRDEIQRLRDEQQRLRDEQEKLRRDAHSQNGHGGDKEGSKDTRGEVSSSRDAGQRKPADQKVKSSLDDKNKNEKGKDEGNQDEPRPPLKDRARTYVLTHRSGVLLAAAGFVVAVIAIVFLVNYLDSYESTDDAQVDGHLNAVSARIAGTVTGVYVDDNQTVAANQLAVDLDPSDYQTAFDSAKASYEQAIAQFHAENPNVPITETSNLTAISSAGADVAAAQAAVIAAEQDYQAKLASVREAEANNNKAQTDVERYRALVIREEISKENYDTIVATAKTQAAAVDASRASAEASQKAIDQARAQLLQAQSKQDEANKNAPRSVAVRRAQLAGREAAVLAAKSQMGQAQLNLSYTKIFAPVAGVISQKTVEVGQRIQPGEELFTISQLDDIWITANFKETQLRKMHSGEKVDIHVDAYGRTFRGYVENMPGATGSVASLLPPENATGNFVKVVQRLPVRIRLNQGEDPQHLLRLGMSVEPKVWLR